MTAALPRVDFIGTVEKRRLMTSRELMNTLMQHRADFVRFVERRVQSAATAEDIVQEAMMRSVQRLGELRHDEAVLGWFYRVLENAILDQHRRAATSSRALERVEQEFGAAVHTFDEAPARTCKCVAKLKGELKPEYAAALERIEVDDVAVKEFAEEAGISRTNAAVRVFRAREALRQKVQAKCGHCAAAGCTDCSCVA